MLPELVHTYQNHTLDSTRWNCYKPRPADIVISTSLKSGTTWTMEIVRQLIFLGQDVPQRHKMQLGELAPWLDNRWGPIDQEIALLEGQQHRRFMKSHLPLDGLPFYPQVQYIVIGRDPRRLHVALESPRQHDGGLPGLHEQRAGPRWRPIPSFSAGHP